jgi:hypothetical protein
MGQGAITMTGQQTDGATKEPHVCRHCGQPMKKWAASQNDFGDGMGFCADILLVCFNDDCPMYVKGWNSLYDTVRRVGSVRHFYNPEDGFQGVLPVGHRDALRGDIIEE